MQSEGDDGRKDSGEVVRGEGMGPWVRNMVENEKVWAGAAKVVTLPPLQDSCPHESEARTAGHGEVMAKGINRGIHRDSMARSIICWVKKHRAVSD